MSRDPTENLRPIWLIAAGVSLVIPVFLPSTVGTQDILQNVIGTSTVTMFVLSFPSSLLGIPLLFVIQAALGVDPNTIGGMYLNMFLLFVLGLVQWFWIVPKIWGSRSDLSILKVPNISSTDAPQQIGGADSRPFLDEASRTPLERVFNDRDEK